MKAPVLASNFWTPILWLVIIILLILLILYLVWLLTRKRRKEAGRAEAAPAPEVPRTPVVEAVPSAAPMAEVAAVVPEVPRTPVPEVAPAAAPADDLTRLEGIGPKVAKVLASIGITTFKALAEADYSRVKQALVDAGWPYMDPAGWIEQAKLAAEGRWEELALLQDQLKGGRR
ncbi:MAG: helix-hairpin-helix domain-containing protein, partial [Anaerolineae bacterium]